MKWMAKESYDKLSLAFLSTCPANNISISYAHREEKKNKYESGEIIIISLCWTNDGSEISDPDGNVWQTEKLDINLTTCSQYREADKIFLVRAGCITAIMNLILEIHNDVDTTVRVMTLDNASRIDREDKRLYAIRCTVLAGVVESRGLTRSLRTGGKLKVFSGEKLTENIPAGNYEIQYHFGTRRRTILKKYVVTIPENPTWLLSIRKIA